MTQESPGQITFCVTFAGGILIVEVVSVVLLIAVVVQIHFGIEVTANKT